MQKSYFHNYKKQKPHVSRINPFRPGPTLETQKSLLEELTENSIKNITLQIKRTM